LVVSGSYTKTALTSPIYSSFRDNLGYKKISSDLKMADKKEKYKSSFGIVRSNPRISGNVKITVDSSENLLA